MIAVIKSTVCIVAFVIRFILMIIHRWFIDTKETRFETIMDILSTIGLIFIAIISVKIQLLRIFPTSNGIIMTPDPLKFNSMTYATNKYLTDVGIYTRWPIDNESTMFADRNMATNYLWLADVTEVINNTCLTINIKANYDPIENSYNLCITKDSNRTCFLMNNKMRYFSSIELGNVEFLKDNSYLEYELKFYKEPAQVYKYLIGYLDYNLNKVTFNETNDANDCRRAEAASMIYARYLPFLKGSEDTYLKKTIGAGFSFYNLNFDLQPVASIWKTGLMCCKMSGDEGPKLNRNINLKTC